jgi:peptidyl-prolyl cis-trans isomerase C
MKPAADRTWQVGRAAAALLALAMGCGQGSAPARPATGELPPGVVARVGAVDVTADRVGRIAAARGVDPASARDLAVRDTLLARAATAQGLDATTDVRLSVENELARRLLRKVLAEARAQPPTEAELAEAAARRWLDVDRPEGSRTVHAIVLVDPARDDEAKMARARALAEVVRAAVLPVSERAATLPPVEGAPPSSARLTADDDPDPLSAAFRRAAATVRADGGLTVRIEPLATVAADGRLLAPGGEFYLPEFARAAAALPARGALSPVVTSPAGLHVILLLERTPALVLTGAARVARLRDDIVNERARAADRQLLASLRPRASIAPDALGLLALVPVEP